MNRSWLESRGWVHLNWDDQWHKCLGFVRTQEPPFWEPAYRLKLSEGARRESRFGRDDFLAWIRDQTDQARAEGVTVVPVKGRGERHVWDSESGLSASEQFIQRVNLVSRDTDPWAQLHISEPMEARGASDLEIMVAIRVYVERKLGYPIPGSPCVGPHLGQLSRCEPCAGCGRCACERPCVCDNVALAQAMVLPGPCWR